MNLFKTLKAPLFSRAQAVAVLAVAVLALGSAPLAHAGRSCEAKPLTDQTITNGMALAQRTAQALDATGAKVVFLARAGQDLHK